jgi:O-antigen/teichoic acid export membrane protein
MNEAIEPPRPAGGLGNRVASSAGILWALNMLLRALQFLTMLVLARVLVPADFGIVALAMTIVGVLDVMTNVQVGAAIIRTTEVDRSHLDTAFTINILRGLATAALLALLAHPLALFLETPELELILYVLTVPALLNALSNPYFILYSRNMDFGREAGRRALAAFLGSAAGIAIALAYQSYWALIAGALVSAFVNLILSWFLVEGRPGLSLARWRDMFGFGSWLLVQNVVAHLGVRIEYFFIGKVFDNATLGAYHLGNQVNNLASADLVPTLARAAFPAMSMINADEARLRRSYLTMQSVALAAALPIGFGIALLAEPLVLLLFGPGWDLAVPVIQFVVPMTALQALGAGVEALAMALGRAQLLATRSMIYYAIRTGLLFAGFMAGGFIGLLVGRTLAGVIYISYNLALAATLTGGRFVDPLLAGARSLAALGVMVGGVLLLPTREFASLGISTLALDIAGRAALGALLYTGTHYALWRAAGRPEGAETRILAQLGRVRARLLGPET